jgi:thioredoxin 1
MEMIRISVLLLALSMVVLLGCGKEAEEEVAERTVEDQTGVVEETDIAAEPDVPEVEEDRPETEPSEKTSESKPETGGDKADGKPVEVGDANFSNEVLESDIPVMVDFWAPWCRPCLIAAPVLEKMAGEFAGRLKVCKLNVDQARSTAMKYGIRSIPTLIIYKDGKVVDQIVGVSPDYEAQLRRKIESHL